MTNYRILFSPMNNTPYPSGRYELNIVTAFGTKAHPTGIPDAPFWIEEIRSRLKYRICILNVAERTCCTVDSPEFGENIAEQFAVYDTLRGVLADVLTRGILPKAQCPQYRLDENGNLTPQ